MNGHHTQALLNCLYIFEEKLIDSLKIHKLILLTFQQG